MDKELKEYLEFLAHTRNTPTKVNVGALKFLASLTPKERLEFINSNGSLMLTDQGDKVVSCSIYSNAICGLYKVTIDGKEAHVCTGPLVRKRRRRSLTWTLISLGLAGATTTYDSYRAADSCTYNPKNVKGENQERRGDSDEFVDISELMDHK